MILSPKTNKQKAKRPQRSVFVHRENTTEAGDCGKEEITIKPRINTSDKAQPSTILIFSWQPASRTTENDFSSLKSLVYVLLQQLEWANTVPWAIGWPRTSSCLWVMLLFTTEKNTSWDCSLKLTMPVTVTGKETRWPQGQREDWNPVP